MKENAGEVFRESISGRVTAPRLLSGHKPGHAKVQRFFKQVLGRFQGPQGEDPPRGQCIFSA